MPEGTLVLGLGMALRSVCVLSGEVLGKGRQWCMYLGPGACVGAPVWAGCWACEGESPVVFWPTAHEQGLGPWGTQPPLMTRPWDFEVLLPPGGSRHKQPRFIWYRFIWG